MKASSTKSSAQPQRQQAISLRLRSEEYYNKNKIIFIDGAMVRLKLESLPT